MRLNRILLGAACVLLASCATLNRATITQIAIDPAAFMVSHPLRYSPDDGKNIIVVPVGFVTDLASIPRLLWPWQAPHEATLGPAVLHDYLYWQQSCDKDEADAVMYLAMRETGMSRSEALKIYIGVRTPLARAAWNKNSEEQKMGTPRFFSKNYVDYLKDAAISPKSTLETILAQAIIQRGVIYPSSKNDREKAACKIALKLFASDSPI